MNSSRSLIFAESVITNALFKRIKNIFPAKSDELLELLLTRKWGKEIVEHWQNEKQFEHLFQGLGEKVDEQAIPLVSIFSELHIQPNQTTEKRYYEPMQWKEPVYNPTLTESPSKENLLLHWHMIINSWKQFIQFAPEDHSIRISSFLDWSENWLSSVPVNKNLQSIPLSIHLRLMHALAIVCGVKCKSFKLLLGDVSGIQSYLFDIAHIGAGKIAKRLRSRSFTLGLLADVVSHKLLLDARLPISNLILSAGGIFYVILPSSYETRDWKKETNKFLYERFQGSIVLHSSEKEIHLLEMTKRFPELLTSCYEGIQRSKGKPFFDLLQNDGAWNDQMFIHDSKQNRDDLCNGCRKFPKVNEEFCEYCLLDEDVGKKLTRTNYLLFKKGHGTIQFENGIAVELLETLPISVDESSYLIQVWNQADAKKAPIQFHRKWVANYIPVAPKGGIQFADNLEDVQNLHEGEPLTFVHMAQVGKGKDLLGYFKADVDNLGMLFTIGFIKERQKESHSFSHILTLSKMFERFFAGGINQWLRNEFKNTYTVFSGGDDLFLIGPWEEILKAAQEIRSRFQIFVGSNPEVTLSAGINILKPKTALPHAAQFVENELENAKENVNVIRAEEKGQFGRDQVSVQGFVMDWTHFKVVTDTSKLLAKWWQCNKLSSSFIYQLSTFSDMYKKYKETGQNEYLKFIPLLNYTIQRNLIEGNILNDKNREDKEILEWLRNLQQVLEQKNKYPLRLNANLLWHYMHLITKISNYYRGG
ncbi:type III-A CRISPR-associated protein Cas10/Csm1 [Calidifontibacillus erzurumensis]|uniref:CRISPR system single-strand-specific deoxyribonuclease Cas10/Csm1 (subtype III-A) n=1 Tax=Calidifontibacillus erzurumensis TaxID=2741433 RepID=A0A8J8GJR6_9BACI|nr:type III-A CRISPR-associated protein Cas10/Csm1 [Calidifontibacillus erzurumensis]NSL53038.1 type III-A CRISPR-associated protein Cas10/Csm1 [Calidifontibacillus erzurumensis]